MLAGADGQFPEMNRYEQRAWATLKKQLRDQHERRSLVPPRVRAIGAAARDKAHDAWERVPGNDSFEAVLEKALLGLKHLVFDPALRSVSMQMVLHRYRRKGYDAWEAADIHRLRLDDVDKVMPSLRARYAIVSAAQGAAAGAAITGEEVATVGASAATVGAAAPVGTGTIVATLAADAAGVLAASARVVAHTGAYYGYPVKGPEEELFALAVLNYGTASTQLAKTKAFTELSQLAKLTAKGAPWAKLDEFAISRVLKKLYAQLGDKLTKRKLGEALPFIGIAIGAGMNAHTLQDVSKRAEQAYRFRFLVDKYGLDPAELLPEPSGDTGGEDIIDIEALLDEERDQPGDEAAA